ncbi:MAG: PilZ domain-containing protein [Methylothermaceae bacterium]|nr:PilZ domain-containing protein [Methylothermaceae bacterium]
MQHRCFTRLKNALPVVLYHGDTHLGRFATRDISLDGMFVETGDLDFFKNDVVQVDLMLFGERYLMRGLVVRRETHGIGLVLIDVNPRYYKSLTHILSEDGAGGRVEAELPACDQKYAMGRAG